MANTNGLIKFTSRDYNSIMEEFWKLVPALTDLWQPSADSDPGVVLGKYLASIADMLGVNLDILSNELYAGSVSQRKNAERLFSLIGYTLGWYTAARTEVTFTNGGDSAMTIDFGFNGSNFPTLNAYTDITNESRVITYNILPMTNSYGEYNSRSTRRTTTSSTDVFVNTDKVTLQPGEQVTRVAIEGELRSTTVSVKDIKNNNYIIKLPSQHIDTTAVWLKAKSSLSSEDFLLTRWKQVDSPMDFASPEPRFAVTYDSYSNAQVEVSNYLNQLDNYDSNYIIIYWIDCSGIIGSIGADVLTNFLPAKPASATANNFDSESLIISNLSNTIEIPHTYTVTGGSPETAKEAYRNSRNYINTWDSLITVPDFQRFLNREAGVDAGLVLDCQKALEINLAIYNNPSLTDSQKRKMYITSYDFPTDANINLDWRNLISDLSDTKEVPFTCNFKTYTAMCYTIHNNFDDSLDYMPSIYTDVKPENYKSQNVDVISYVKYKPPVSFIDGVNADFRPLQAMSVELGFGYARIFPWYVVGEIYPTNPVSKDVGDVIIAKVKEALALYFSPANRSFGQKPTTMEVVEVVQNADSRIRYFDAGSLYKSVINWGEKRVIGTESKIVEFDIEYFNPISFARYKDVGATDNNIRIAPDYIIK